MNFPLEVPAIRVEQPLGTFYVAVLSARVLLQVAYSHVMSATLNDDGVSYTLHGTQRTINKNRIPQITDYIDRSDSTFPNSIILAANFQQNTDLTEDEIETGEDQDSETTRPLDKTISKEWLIKERGDGTHSLYIPTPEKLAAIIDGQHRLFAFTKATPIRLDMGLICAIFLDLPKPFQAQIFATINSNQKPVDKSLTYELFGYNIAEESAELWTPDKLAVFMTRKLGTEIDSPLKGRIVIAPKRDGKLIALNDSASWKVSTAAVVEGIIRLISSNPKRDSNFLLTSEAKPRESLRGKFRDKSPLRDVYFEVNDMLLYVLVKNYLTACQDVFWSRASASSFIFKTVGIQAIFDTLRKISPEAIANNDISAKYFREKLDPAISIDFSGEQFRNASGSGRSAIRKAIEQAISP